MADEFSPPSSLTPSSTSQQNSSSSTSQQNSSSSTNQSASSSNPTSETTTNSGNSGSQSLASTYPIEEGEYQERIEENIQNEGWGQVVPVNPGQGYHSLNLQGDAPITFGRHPDLDYVFRKELIPNDYLHFSKKHFHIQKYENGEVKITDTSSNGTFVNGTIVGKGRDYPLTHLSTISLGLPNLRVFIFINHEDKRREDEKMPADFKAKYSLENIMLGEGAYGTVKKCFLKKKPSLKFAVKIMKKGMYSRNDKYDITYEASILAKIDHKNIVTIKDCFENENYLFMVMELVSGGELFHFIKNKGPMAEEKASKFFLQLLHGVSYLHKNGITHRDLKPENILLDDKDFPENLKITDFGMSRFVSENSLMETTAVGTRLYLSPEIINPRVKGYTKKVDSWALGCLLFIILGGYPPFSLEEGDEGNVDSDILNGRFTFHPERWDKISEKAKDLVRRLLTVDANDRLSVDEALQHSFVKTDTEDGSVPPLSKRAKSN